MADRIISMRTLLREKLEGLGSPLPWKHVTEQIGMFCYSGMTPEMASGVNFAIHGASQMSHANVHTRTLTRVMLLSQICLPAMPCIPSTHVPREAVFPCNSLPGRSCLACAPSKMGQRGVDDPMLKMCLAFAG